MGVNLIPELIAGDLMKFREVSEPKAKPGTIEVHIIRPGRGSSGYYTDDALRQACEAGVYPAGMLMHWDHPTRQQEKDVGPARVTDTIAAVFIEAAKYRDQDDPNAWDGPGPYALAEVRPKFREDLKWLAGKIGVSHYVDGKSKEGIGPDGKKGRIITELVPSLFNSVDFVTIPGAGGHSRFNEVLAREAVCDLPKRLKEIIRHEGGKWVLYSHDGDKKLGTFESEEDAKDRERQIQFFKHQGEAADGDEEEPDKTGIRFVIGFPKGGGGSETQSVLFLKDKWTSDQAKAWLKDHDLTSGDMEETEDSYRFRQEDPEKYDRFRTVIPSKVQHAQPSESKKKENRMPDKQLSIRLAEAKANDPELYDEILRQVREDLKGETVNETQKTKLAEVEKTLKEVKAENETLKKKLVEKAARDYVIAEVAKAKLPETAGKALTESLMGQAPVETDGSLDAARFAEIVSKAIKAKQDEIAAILKEAGATVHDNGRTDPAPENAASVKKAREDYRDTLLENGMAKEMADRLAGVGAA